MRYKRGFTVQLTTIKREHGKDGENGGWSWLFLVIPVVLYLWRINRSGCLWHVDVLFKKIIHMMNPW